VARFVLKFLAISCSLRFNVGARSTQLPSGSNARQFSRVGVLENLAEQGFPVDWHPVFGFDFGSSASYICRP